MFGSRGGILVWFNPSRFAWESLSAEGAQRYGLLLFFKS